MKQIIGILSTISFLMALNTEAANIVSINSKSVPAEGIFTVEIQVDNTDAFVAFQTDIPIPAGFTFQDGSALLNSMRISGHSLSASMVSSNLRLIAYSAANTPFIGNSGTLISFNLKAPSVPGNYNLSLTNTLLGNGTSMSVVHSVKSGVITVQGPNIQLTTKELNFGRVALTSNSSQYITVRNIGNQNLVVSSITFSESQFSSPQSAGFTITAGQSRQVQVVFAPTIKGNYSKQIKFNSNDPDNKEVSVSLKSVGYAVNELHTGDISAASGNKVKLDFFINNMESFTGFQFDLTLPAPLKYRTGTAVLSRDSDHVVTTDTINANTLRVVAFSGSGKNFIGTNGKILSLDFDLTGVAGYYPLNISNVLIADAVGENISSDSYNGNLQVTSPDIHANSSMDFGDVSVLAEGNQDLRIYNYGQETLIVSQLLFSSDYFSSNQSLPFSVTPSGYFDLPVKFFKTTKGAVTGTLKIISNDTDEYPYVVQLNANSFVPNFINIGEYQANQNDTFLLQIEITNEEPFVAFQFDLQFSNGISPDINKIYFSERSQDHNFAALPEQNKLKVVCYSATQKEFIGKSGTVLNIPFITSATIPDGSYPLILSNAILSNATSENILYNVKNGNLTISPSTNILEWEIPVLIYPNPSNGYFQVNLNSDFLEEIEISIHNSAGQEVYKKIIGKTMTNESQLIDLSRNSKGLYYLKISGGNYYRVEKIILQ